MQAGKLRHRVSLQRRIDGSNGVEPIVMYGTYATVWAEVTPLAGRDLMIAKQLSAKATGAVKIRYRNDMKITDRISHGGRFLYVNHIADTDERRRELVLTCAEEVE